jgi:hypothetical protein
VVPPSGHRWISSLVTLPSGCGSSSWSWYKRKEQRRDGEEQKERVLGLQFIETAG